MVGGGFSIGEGLGCSFNESMGCSREGVGVFFQGEADEVCTVSRRHPCLSLTLNLLASSSLVLGVKMMFNPSVSTTALVRHGSSGKKGKGMFSRLLVQLSVCGNPCCLPHAKHMIFFVSGSKKYPSAETLDTQKLNDRDPVKEE